MILNIIIYIFPYLFILGLFNITSFLIAKSPQNSLKYATRKDIFLINVSILLWSTVLILSDYKIVSNLNLVHSDHQSIALFALSLLCFVSLIVTYLSETQSIMVGLQCGILGGIFWLPLTLEMIAVIDRGYQSYLSIISYQYIEQIILGSLLSIYMGVIFGGLIGIIGSAPIVLIKQSSKEKYAGWLLLSIIVFLFGWWIYWIYPYFAV